MPRLRSRDAKRQAAKGVDVTRCLATGDYLREWLAGRIDIRVSTRRSYRQHVEDYLVPHLGRIELSALRRAHVEAMFVAIDEASGTDRRTMGGDQAADTRHVAQRARRRQREGLVTMNAARLARLETGRRPKVRPWEPEELGAFLDHAASDRHGPLFELIAATGLRRGEALALQWSTLTLSAAL